MNRITIACPIALTCEYITDTAPIWVDASGNEYRVASGIFENPPEAVAEQARLADNTIQMVYGESGLEVLAQMGLRTKEDTDEQTTA